MHINVYEAKVKLVAFIESSRCPKPKQFILREKKTGSAVSRNKKTPKIKEKKSKIKEMWTFEEITSSLVQGCQIFRDTIYQNEEKYTKFPLNYHMAIKYTR
jgi:hypothetical protein